MEKAIFYIFVLSVILIAAAYYIGLTSDANAVFAGAKGLIQTSTGRNAAGNFAPYPAQPAGAAA